VSGVGREFCVYEWAEIRVRGNGHSVVPSVCVGGVGMQAMWVQRVSTRSCVQDFRLVLKMAIDKVGSLLTRGVFSGRKVARPDEVINFY
jgi:hypothetical protein